MKTIQKLSMAIAVALLLMTAACSQQGAKTIGTSDATAPAAGDDTTIAPTDGSAGDIHYVDPGYAYDPANKGPIVKLAPVNPAIKGIALVSHPSVASSAPSDQAVNVALDANPSVTFDHEMDPDSVKAHFQVVVLGVFLWFPVDGSVKTTDNRTFTFTPAMPLKNGGTYGIQVRKEAKDADGSTLGDDFAAGFTTAEAPPTIVSTNPVDGDSVSMKANITVTFDEEMNPDSVEAHFHVDHEFKGLIGGSITTSDNKTFTFSPANWLEDGDFYGIQIDGEVQNKDGTAMGGEFVLVFGATK